jgi:hypothetical protein
MLTGWGVVDNILALRDDHGAVVDGCPDNCRGLGDETGSLAGMTTTWALKKESDEEDDPGRLWRGTRLRLIENRDHGESDRQLSKSQGTSGDVLEKRIGIRLHSAYSL